MCHLRIVRALLKSENYVLFKTRLLMTTNKIAFDDFLQKLKGKIEKTAEMNGGVFRIKESEQLFYVLTRANNKYQPWGARKNVIDDLKGRKWFLIFLSEAPLLNFFLTEDNVTQSINEKWSIANSEDYKIEEKDLIDYYTFRTIEELNDIIFEEDVIEARKLTQEERLSKIEKYSGIPTTSKRTIDIFNRDPNVKAEVLERANGKCEFCLQNAPFMKVSDNKPFLEVHHIKWLSKEGEDTLENAIALCPNCHRGAHFGGYNIKRKNGT